MLLKAVAFMSVCALVSTNAFAEDQVTRAASTSLCGDAYLLALAPEKAAALSWQSRDDISRVPEDKRALPRGD